MDISVEELTIDEIFDSFESDRDTKLMSLKNKPEEIWKQDDYDKKCTSELHNDQKTVHNKTRDNPLKSKYYICINCRMLMKLIDIRNPFERTTIYFEDGRKACVNIVKYKGIKPKIYEDPRNSMIILTSRATNIKKIIACDPFTNNILVSWILWNIFKNHDVRLTEKIIKAFVCDSNGYTIDYVRPKQLKKTVCGDNIEDIVLQLKFLCQILSNYDYYHGNYSLDNINFYKYNRTIPGICKRNFRIMLSINGFEDSSVTFDNIRLMRYHKEEDRSVNVLNFNYNAAYNNIVTCKDYFRVRYNCHTDFMFCIGLHNYKAEYNFYNWIIALCRDKQFFYGIRMTKLWINIWKEDELRLIEDRIRNSKIYDTKLILSSISMRIGVLELVTTCMFS